jgi:hypothetical protein
MKQNITQNQLNELNKRDKQKLIKYLFPVETKFCHYSSDTQLLFSIGEMIEFLDQLDLEVCISKPHLTHYEVSIYDKYSGKINLKTNLGFYQSTELCDALWKACKEALHELH